MELIFLPPGRNEQLRIDKGQCLNSMILRIFRKVISAVLLYMKQFETQDIF